MFARNDKQNPPFSKWGKSIEVNINTMNETISPIHALVLGIIQGIAEWLPISSSGHLVLVQKFFRFGGGITFDIFLHLSTLLVILIFFRKDIRLIGKALLSRDKKSSEFKIGIYVIFATVVTGFMGILLHTKEHLLMSLPVVGCCFLFTAILLFFSKKSGNESLNWKKALIIGFFQGIALLPGVSRSGSTISIARILKINETDSFRFSFLLMIPATLGAVVLKLNDITKMNGISLLIGFAAAFCISFPSLLLLKKAVYKNRLYLFGFYCLLLSIITFAV